ncbi:VOC family protein [Pseudoxanthomonas sp. SL93]|uniref:VOC family protein n=1 Tax=Pseudoxanthomonas sp. SL93 TaxID=2995142 RepID=UPI00227165C8|nr:VOC family protein [Pseudoxanthomonas sp. SL93]WAC64901.1 VOC family protein [Pseudoxanthomonas sp. SL93]
MQLLINIDVPDLPAAEALYVQAFGLTAARRFGEGGVELLGAQAPIYLLLAAPGTTAAASSLRDYDRHWTPVHLDVVVDELEPALQRALAAGMRQESDIREANWGRIVRLADPFGHGWCLLQFVGRGYDELTT